MLADDQLSRAQQKPGASETRADLPVAPETLADAPVWRHDPPHQGGSGRAPMRVVYDSLETPDMFNDGAEVVIEGHLDPSSVFVADNVMAKCPSKFEAKRSEKASF